MPRDGQDYEELLQPSLSGDAPLFRLLATALRTAIDRGDIPLGTALPPERSLANTLNLSRATVAAAYGLLKAQGWLESRQGSGTWVRMPDESPGAIDAVSTGPLLLDRETGEYDRGGGSDTDLVELSVAAMAPTATVRRVLSSLTADDVAWLAIGHGYLPAGLPLLRDRVADHLSTVGIETAPTQVVVTNGAHQAISLIVRQVLRPGDNVLVESPTYPGVLDILRRFEAHPIPLPVDAQGARTDLVADLLARADAKLVYLTPHFHSPTGAVMPAERRREVASVADRSGVAVIEDMAMADIDLDGRSLPAPIASHAQGDTVHVVGSVSKLFWAGMRVGWVRSPDSWHARLLSTKTVADMGTSPVTQFLAARLLEHRAAVLDERRPSLCRQRDLLLELLAEQLPDWSHPRPDGGLSVFSQLPSGNAEEFAEMALRHGVAVIPGPALSVDSGNRRFVRLSYGVEPAAIRLGVTRLAAAWQAYSTRSGGVSRLLV